jgi:hypothetical protein
MRRATVENHGMRQYRGSVAGRYGYPSVAHTPSALPGLVPRNILGRVWGEHPTLFLRLRGGFISCKLGF